MKKDNEKISKFLSYVLRHNPQSIELTLDDKGWARIDELIRCAAKHGKEFTRAQLQEVVETNDKRRFSISEDGNRIRANQGHSISVDLALQALEPPEKLYHGTATRCLDSILRDGLQSRGRHHVHLSKDIATALNVGQRHGKPTVLEIEAQRMMLEGYRFYCSANGVWLTDEVPPQYFSVMDRSEGFVPHSTAGKR